MPHFDSGVRFDSGARYDVSVEPPDATQGNMKKPKLQSRSLTVSDLAVTATRIKNMMTAAASLFPNSDPDLTALNGEITTLNDKIADTETARLTYAEKLAARDDTRKMVETRLAKLQGQVHDVAQGNVETIHTAGMAATNDPQPVVMTQVQNLVVKASDQDAELLGSCDKMKGAKYYRIQVSTEPIPGNFKDHLNTTKTRFSLNHSLVSGSKVYVRVCAGNGHGEGPWSDIAWKTVP